MKYRFTRKPHETSVWPEQVHSAETRNTSGRDLVVGDLHGHFTTLEHALEALCFDPSRDRLYSVGDLIDRGPRSADALGWITKNKIRAVRGNHEQMMVNTLVLGPGGLTKSGPNGLWADKGGMWWWRLSEEARRAERWRRALRTVPFMRTVETEGEPVGIVHTTAHYHHDWQVLVDGMVRAAAWEEEPWARHRGGTNTPTEILWSRPEIERACRDADGLPPAMGAIGLVVSGHTPDLHPRWTSRNQVCIDTGVHVDAHGHLTVAEVQTGAPVLHCFARVE